MKTYLSLSFLLICFQVSGQQDFNFDFEKTRNGNPLNWENFGSEGYTLSLDTLNAQSGKTAAVIEYSGNAPNFKAWAYNIPAIYTGKRIKLTGYVKTENVTDGWAGLWMRIDPQVEFDNMQNRGITGSTDWKQYEIAFDLHPDKAQQIVVGGLLVGKGKMWLDHLDVTIDGLPLKDVKRKELLPAEKDTAFNAGSGIVFPPLDEKLTNDLELLGKVWGFLKYHHPAIAKGKYNWDFELFRMLPEFLKNKSRPDRDKVLVKWIESLGKVPACKSCRDIAQDAFLKPDHAWITATPMSKSLQEKLLNIHKNRHQGEHFYIGMADNIGNPEFMHEMPYANMPYPDAGFRLLTLYKYWNMIHYFFPYKHLMDKPWNGVLRAYIPMLLDAANELEYEQAAVRLIGDIQDTHANLWGGSNAMNEQKGKYYAPVHVRFIENQLVVTDYYNPELKEKTGLELGDVITNINGKPVDQIIGEVKKYYPASNEPTRLRDISADLLRANEPEIRIGFIRDRDEKTKKLTLYERDSLNIYRWYPRDDGGQSYRLLNDSIGYVTLKNIKELDVPLIKKDFKNTKGIIIDIRNYPSAFMPFMLGSFFVSDNTEFVKFTAGDVNMPGQFRFGPPLEIPPQGETYPGKLVVLVNELTQSQAEYTSMAFRAGERTTIIGSTTAGADGNVSGILLPGGLRTMISGIGVYYPDGKETQRIGIVPDVEVNLTIQGIKEGKDELLIKAIEVINK